MRFYICECGHIWLPKKGEVDFFCPYCDSKEINPLPYVTVYQCKNKSNKGVVLLKNDGSKAELKIPWDEFNQQFVFMDTDAYWAKKIA